MCHSVYLLGSTCVSWCVRVEVGVLVEVYLYVVMFICWVGVLKSVCVGGGAPDPL